MFGHDDKRQDENHDEPQHDGVLDNGTVHPDDALTEHQDDSMSQETSEQSPAFTPGPSHDDAGDSDDNASNDHTDEASTENAEAESAPAVSATLAPSAGSDDLLNIKQSALKQLTPLVDHLEQTPEERFRTTMMMIQASDNHALIKDAYAAAESIGDEKTKAQALLDIVNEINYFTQHDED